MSDADHSRRQLLAQFLRSRRGRVSPQRAGFPIGSRRRTKGLRREEVAVLAGLSPSWYTYLEQGRKINPSPEVLDSLAGVLDLTEDERRYMHTLAYGQVIKPQPLDVELTEEDLISQMVAATDSVPYPVYACNIYCDLVAWNQAASEWYDDWSRTPLAERNIIRWLFTSQRARQSLVHWESETRDIVARWRGEAARRTTDGRLRQLVAEFSRLSPQFADCWGSHEVQEHRTRIRTLRHPRLGEQPMRLVFMQPPDATALAIVFHLPIHVADSR